MDLVITVAIFVIVAGVVVGVLGYLLDRNADPRNG
jgi:F0F1-type ATP synthase assembly protein I